jgi:hypothetical protein
MATLTNGAKTRSLRRRRAVSWAVEDTRGNSDAVLRTGTEAETDAGATVALWRGSGMSQDGVALLYELALLVLRLQETSTESLHLLIAPGQLGADVLVLVHDGQELSAETGNLEAELGDLGLELLQGHLVVRHVEDECMIGRECRRLKRLWRSRRLKRWKRLRGLRRLT